MLEKVRKPGKGKSLYMVFGWALLAIICVAFMFMGLTPDVGSTFTGGGAAAIVNDTPIPIRQFTEAVERETRQIGSAFNSLPAAQRRTYEKSIRERTLNSLVAQEVLYQSAQEHGFFATDIMVRDELMNLPYFQENGSFSRERYMSLMTQNRIKPSDFENQIRRQVTIGGVRDGFMRALKKPDQMRSLESQVKNAKINIEFVRFSKTEIDMGAATAPAALKAFVESNKDEVKEYYQNNKSDFERPKEVNARHILIKSDGSLDGDKKALATIEEIRSELTKENFAELAKAKSEDKGSAAKGGSLGFFGKGRMVPEFEKMAMSLDVGTISEPVKTQFGYHLILVDETKGGGFRELEDAALDIAKSIIEKKGRDEAMAAIEEAVESGGDLRSLISKYKLKWEETGEFTLDQTAAPKIGRAEEVVTEALRLQAGVTSKRLVRSEGSAHIVRLKSLNVSDSGKNTGPEGFSSAAIEAMNQWAEDLRDTARVSVNTNVLNL